MHGRDGKKIYNGKSTLETCKGEKIESKEEVEKKQLFTSWSCLRARGELTQRI